MQSPVLEDPVKNVRKQSIYVKISDSHIGLEIIRISKQLNHTIDIEGQIHMCLIYGAVISSHSLIQITVSY